MKMELYDRPTCCSRSVDPALFQVTEDLRLIAKYGVEVYRYSLARTPEAFTANMDVLKQMGTTMERLPITVVDGRIVAVGRYLSREELAQALDIKLDG
ncbi:MAG: arsD [Proteobacteria bacterium]|nr:arsD [Pseudomonadota bacterium]